VSCTPTGERPLTPRTAAHNARSVTVQTALHKRTGVSPTGPWQKPCVCFRWPKRTFWPARYSCIRCVLVRQLETHSDPRARLTRGARTVLHHAVDAQQRGIDEHNSVRRSLRSLCRIARSQGVRVEHLILICKDAWRTLPERRQIPGDAGDKMLKRVIAQCVDEYHRTDGEDLSPARQSAEAASVPEASLSFMFGPLS
jgi:hypothetical protein